ncbi:hypothetical protein VKT23_007810 [Stygiomarasmius scandens]|uniref:Integrase catalytic domain-containing protein n=1 Tax=Marasmiellus scandens TaxID=2682957 RepID=A0ABR1JKM5_9AGAR
MSSPPRSSESEIASRALREHYNHYLTYVNNFLNNDRIDPFRIQRLKEELESFQVVVEELGHNLPAEERNTVQTNLVYMIHDLTICYDNSMQESHQGRPELTYTLRTGGRGRPRTIIDRTFLEGAYGEETTSGIARYLGVSRSVVRDELLRYGIAAPGFDPELWERAEVEEGLVEDDEPDDLLDPNIPISNSAPLRERRNRSYLSTISNDQLDELVLQLRRESFRRAGITTMDGLLRSLGHRLPRKRIQECLRRIDPVHHGFDRIHIRRRGYSVPGPNSLWHHDGQHGLIRYKILIHGFIDGHSRLITGLRANNNNRADTVLMLFLLAISTYGRPSRVRGDMGKENNYVAAYMMFHNGLGRGSYIWGQSIHNTRIERLWVDTTAQVTSTWQDRFANLELRHGMDINNENHVWLLQYVFLSFINKNLRLFAEGWNRHPMQIRGQANRSPRNMFYFDMFANGMRGEDVQLEDAEMEFYGLDWDALYNTAVLDSNILNNRQPHVIVEPPTQILTAEEIRTLDMVLSPWSHLDGLTDSSVVELWRTALVTSKSLRPVDF